MSRPDDLRGGSSHCGAPSESDSGTGAAMRFLMAGMAIPRPLRDKWPFMSSTGRARRNKTQAPVRRDWAEARAEIIGTTQLPQSSALLEATRALLLMFALCLPFLYDRSVLEAARDLRSTALHATAGLSIILLSAARFLQDKPIAPRRPPFIFWIGLTLLFWAGLASFSSISLNRVIPPMKDFIALALLAVVSAAVWNERFSRNLMWALCLPLFFMIILALAQDARWDDEIVRTQLPRWLNTVASYFAGALGYFEQAQIPGVTFANRNLAASFTGLLLPLTALLIRESRTHLARAVAIALFGSAFWLLILCRSRATWVSLAAGTASMLVIFHWIRFRGSISPRRLPLVVIAVALAVVIATFILERFTLREQWLHSSTDWIRPAYIINSISIIRDHWLTGVGPGNFGVIYPLYHDAIVDTPRLGYNVAERPQYAHNDLFQAFVELGVFGGAAYAATLLCTLFYAIKVIKHGTPGLQRRAYFLGLSILCLLTNSLMDFPLQFPAAAAVVCLLMGGITSDYEETEPKPESRSGGRIASLLLLGIGCMAVLTCLYDDVQRRSANVVMRQGMARLASGKVDEESIRLMELARDLYPRESKARDSIALAYVSYRGQQKISAERRIAAIKDALTENPWNPYLLAALANTYLAIVLSEEPATTLSASSAFAEVEQLFPTLWTVAHFSDFTFTIGGTIALLRGNLCASEAYFRLVLSGNKDDRTAAAGLMRINDIWEANHQSADTCVTASPTIIVPRIGRKGPQSKTKLPAPTCLMSFDHTAVAPDENAVLRWTSQGASIAVIKPWTGQLPTTGSLPGVHGTMNPQGIFAGPGGIARCTATLTPAPAPVAHTP